MVLGAARDSFLSGLGRDAGLFGSWVHGPRVQELAVRSSCAGQVVPAGRISDQCTGMWQECAVAQKFPNPGTSTGNVGT